MANDVTIRMALDKSAVEAGLRSMRASVNSFAQEKFDSLKSALGFGAIVAGIRSTISEMKQLKRDAEDFGVDTSFLQTFSHLTEKFGGTAEDAGAALQKFNVLIGEARSGTEAAAQKFAALGISLTDSAGRSKGAQELLKEVADAYRRTGDSADKAAIAMDFFGRKGASINNVLAMGRAELEETEKAYLRFGLIVTESNINTLSELKSGFGSVANFLQNTLGVFVRGLGSLYGATGGFFAGIEQIIKDLAAGRGVNIGQAWQMVVDGLTAGEERFAQATRDSGLAATQSAAALKKASEDKRKAQEDLERAILEMADDETKLLTLKQQQAQIVMDLEEHALNEVESLKKQVELQKNKNEMAKLEEQIATRKANQTERESRSVAAMYDAQMTLARRRQDLQTTKEDRSKYTLEELAGARSGYFGGQLGQDVELAKRVQRETFLAEQLRMAGRQADSAKAFSRADELRKGIQSLRDAERYPFKAMEEGIVESAESLRDIETALVQQGIIVKKLVNAP